MTVRSQTYPIHSEIPTLIPVVGRFAGINGAAPTTVYGRGFTVARSGEGVFVVTLKSPCAAFVAAQVSVNVATDFHTVSWALSNSGRTLTITHSTVAYASIASGVAAEDVAADITFVAWIVESDLGVVTGV